MRTEVAMQHGLNFILSKTCIPVARASGHCLQPVHNVTDNSSDSEYQLFVVHTPNGDPLKTTLLVEEHQLTMEIDMAMGSRQLISEEFFHERSPSTSN